MLGSFKTCTDLHNVTNPTLDNASRRLLCNLKKHLFKVGFVDEEPEKRVLVCVLY